MAGEAITITKQFSVNKSELYKAWTDEASLKQWWRPSGKILQTVDTVLEEGGSLVYEFTDSENGSGGLKIEGTYNTVLPEEKLIYSWNWLLENIAVENGNYLLTVEFFGEGEESEIKVTQESTSEFEGVHPHQQGWEDALASLKDLVSRN